MLGEEDRTVSFDVISLFTRSHLKLLFECSQPFCMKTGHSWIGQTSRLMSSANMWSFVCARQVKDEYFVQLESTAMGSPLSPIVANLLMESLEKVGDGRN